MKLRRDFQHIPQSHFNRVNLSPARYVHVGQQRHPPRPKGGAGPVADEGPEGVGDQGEADGLDGPVEPRPVLEAVASLGRRDPGVGEDGFDEARGP